MSILGDQQWLELFTWIESNPANGIIPMKREPHRVGSLFIYLHDLSQPAASAPRGPENIPLSSNRPSGQKQPTIRPKFRPLQPAELAILRREPDPRNSLWPKPRALVGHWLPQPVDDILGNLEAAIGYLRGCAPVNDSVATTNIPGYFKHNKFPFDLPINLALDDETRGDCILRGVQSPALNSQGIPVQHWTAMSYIFMRGTADMGAVIMSRNESIIPYSIDVCEMQALIILLDRQTVFQPNKMKLRAWLISINPNRGFRILEAWLDQNTNKYAFHFSILEERSWPPPEVYQLGWRNKLIDGSTDEWKWLLSWALAQRTD
ncbi:hypothetical protein PG987_014045 [Apiospora arundinis]